MRRNGRANKTEQELLTDISHKLDVLIGTMAVQGKPRPAQVRILTKLGLSSPEIGALLNVDASAVRHARTDR